MKRALFASLQAKILFYSLLPFVLVVLVIIVFGVQVFNRIPRRVAQQRESEMARLVAAQVQRDLAEAAAAAVAYGAFVLRSSAEPAGEGRYDASLSGFPQDLFDGGFAVFSETGELLYAEPASEAWRQLIRSDAQTVLRDERPLVTDVIRAPADNSPALALTAVLPAQDGEGQAVVISVFTLAGSRLSQRFASLLEFESTRSGFAYLVDGRGKFIYHRNRTLLGSALAGTVSMMGATYGLNGAVLTRDLSGERVIAGYAPVEGTRWALITRKRWQAIVGPVRLYSLLILAILVIGGSASALLVLFAVGRILKPIRELTHGAERIAAGSFEHRIVTATGDEIEELARRFNTMADSLGGMYRSLEQKVEARTREALEQQRRLAVVEERSRVARDLHDSVSQSLYSVTLFAETARRHIVVSDVDRATQSLDQLITAARQALREMRLMVFELRPSELENMGLVGVLRQRLQTVERRAGIEIRIDAPSCLVIPKAVEQELYSLAQEALNNALRHAAATCVSLRLQPSGAGLVLEVRDNGLGFDAKRPGGSGGVGIRGMRERVQRLGGRMEIESAPGKGTAVRVRVGLHKEEE